MSWNWSDEPSEFVPSNKEEEELFAQFKVGEKVHGILNSIGAGGLDRKTCNMMMHGFWNTLHYVAYWGMEEATADVVEKIDDINAVSSDGETAPSYKPTMSRAVHLYRSRGWTCGGAIAFPCLLATRKCCVECLG